MQHQRPEHAEFSLPWQHSIPLTGGVCLPESPRLAAKLRKRVVSNWGTTLTEKSSSLHTLDLLADRQSHPPAQANIPPYKCQEQTLGPYLPCSHYGTSEMLS